MSFYRSARSENVEEPLFPYQEDGSIPEPSKGKCHKTRAAKGSKAPEEKKKGGKMLMAKVTEKAIVPVVQKVLLPPPMVVQIPMVLSNDDTDGERLVFPKKAIEVSKHLEGRLRETRRNV